MNRRRTEPKRISYKYPKRERASSMYTKYVSQVKAQKTRRSVKKSNRMKVNFRFPLTSCVYQATLSSFALSSLLVSHPVENLFPMYI
uniref:Ovule protein n=1 Tax=Heterorhabditis bacteriophora TaxID=37862 RepID=A0A1I7X7I1_HETBA